MGDLDIHKNNSQFESLTARFQTNFLLAIKREE